MLRVSDIDAYLAQRLAQRMLACSVFRTARTLLEATNLTTDVKSVCCSLWNVTASFLGTNYTLRIYLVLAFRL